jgi:hypothetical protein
MMGSISRAVGRDREGVLDIGKSVHLRRRLAAFFRCVTAKKARHGHMAGWRYKDLGLHRQYPPERLEVCWCTAEDEDEALRLEADALEEYARKHGELPPLNYGGNWAERKRQATTGHLAGGPRCVWAGDDYGLGRGRGRRGSVGNPTHGRRSCAMAAAATVSKSKIRDEPRLVEARPPSRTTPAGTAARLRQSSSR